MSAYHLQCRDIETVEISAKALQQSIFLRTMVEDAELTPDRPIPLAEVDGPTARKVVQWCEKHKDDPAPEPEVRESGPKPSSPPFQIPHWDNEFLSKDNLSIPEMTELIKAANYLEIPWLYKYCCKQLFMDYINKRSTEQLRAMFEPKDDEESCTLSFVIPQRAPCLIPSRYGNVIHTHHVTSTTPPLLSFPLLLSHCQMSFFSKLFVFALGGYCGAYGAQNYEIPKMPSPEEMYRELEEYIRKYRREE